MDKTKPHDTSWQSIVMKYNYPKNLISWWQVINTVVPYIGLWILMYYSLEISYWLTLFLSIFAAGLLVRMFIIFHDCGHGSFFKSERMNRLVGIPLGLLAFTPYHRWHHDHKEHHATVGNLDKRGVGDVETLTVDEYKSLSKQKKFSYRFYRHPIFLLLIAPPLLFLIQHRLPKSYMSKKEHLYVHFSTAAIVLGAFLISLIIGWKAYLLIQLPIIYIAAVHGVWLFYVQHQYKTVKWVRSEDWDYKTIALEGSSFFKLPKVLHWFTGNIGFHHVHHLSPRIPNYKLMQCYNENSIFQNTQPITFFSSLQSLRLRLWDEKRQKLVGFNEI